MTALARAYTARVGAPLARFAAPCGSLPKAQTPAPARARRAHFGSPPTRFVAPSGVRPKAGMPAPARAHPAHFCAPIARSEAQSAAARGHVGGPTDGLHASVRTHPTRPVWRTLHTFGSPIGNPDDCGGYDDGANYSPMAPWPPQEARGEMRRRWMTLFLMGG
eukprot:9480412-Pyramimonas_sp.AAC.1